MSSEITLRSSESEDEQITQTLASEDSTLDIISILAVSANPTYPHLEGNKESYHIETRMKEESECFTRKEASIPYDGFPHYNNYKKSRICDTSPNPFERRTELANRLVSEIAVDFSFDGNIPSDSQIDSEFGNSGIAKVKFSYLKKGEGISRYKIKPLIGFRKNPKLSNCLPQRKLAIRALRINSQLPPNVDCIKTGSKFDCLTKRNNFELLEQMVERPSFCSTSSEVDRLLKESDTSVCSTPISSKNNPQRPIFIPSLNFEVEENSKGNSENVHSRESIYSSLNYRKLQDSEGGIGLSQDCQHQMELHETGDDGNNSEQIVSRGSESSLDPKLNKINISDGKKISVSPKVQFCEQGVEILEFSDQKDQTKNNTASHINESDLFSISDLEDLIAFPVGISPINQKGTLFTSLVGRVASKRFTKQDSSDDIKGNNVRHNHLHTQGQINTNLPENDSTSKSKFTQDKQAVKISPIFNLPKEPSSTSESVGGLAGISSKSKNVPLQKGNGDIDFEAHKLLLLSNVNELKKEIDIFKEKSATLEKERKQQAFISRDLKALQTNFSKMESEKKTSIIEITNFKAQNLSLRRENRTLRDENKLLRAENNTYKSEKLALKDELLTLKLKMDAIEEKQRRNSQSLISAEENKENVEQNFENHLEHQSPKNLQDCKGYSAKRKLPLSKSVSNAELATKYKSNSKLVVTKQSSIPTVSNSDIRAKVGSDIHKNFKNLRLAEKSSLKSKSSTKSKKVHFYSSLEYIDPLPNASENSSHVESNLLNKPVEDASPVTLTSANGDYLFNRNLTSPKLFQKQSDFSFSSNSDDQDELACSTSSKRTDSIDDNGIKEVTYSNGNKKKLYPNGISVHLYHNGDKETFYHDKTIYFYAKDNTTLETFLDGRKIFHFPNGQRETEFKDGSYQIIYPDNSSKTVYRDGKEICVSSNGARTTTYKEGDKIIEFPNGQKEIYHNDEIKRTFPDGTVKILYPDGSQETRYCSGLVRLKDKEGNVKIKM